MGCENGASRNLGDDVRASEPGVVDSCLQKTRGHRFQMGALSVALEAHRGGRRYIVAALDVVAREPRRGVRSRRRIFLATCAIA